MDGTSAGNAGTARYVSPPTAGPISWTMPPKPKIVESTRAWRGPPTSRATMPISVGHPLPMPSTQKRTTIASHSRRVTPKSKLPTSTDTIVATSAGLRPKRSAAWPQSADVGMRESGTIVARTPTTKPAESSSSAQPLSTARKPAYAKSEAME